MGGPWSAHRRRNRVRIVVLWTMSVLVYLAINVAFVIGVLAVASLFGLVGSIDNVDTMHAFRVMFVIGIAAGTVVGTGVGLWRIRRARDRIHHAVIDETAIRLPGPGEYTRVRNLLEGLAVAADIEPPHFAIIDDPAPNSLGIGTRPGDEFVVVTTGLVESLRRDELEAILAYEVSRIASLDIALSTWATAITHDALKHVEEERSGFIRSFAKVPAWFAERLQVWTMRHQVRDRDLQAVAFTRHPHALVRALEVLREDPSEVAGLSRATAPLWVEFPFRALGREYSENDERLADELDLDRRIDALRDAVGLPPTPVPTVETQSPQRPTK